MFRTGHASGKTASVLAEETGSDERVAAYFALFHDARRFNDDHDPDHGQRGADLAAQWRGEMFELEDEAFDALYPTQNAASGILISFGQIFLRTIFPRAWCCAKSRALSRWAQIICIHPHNR